jgi:hypothetical protein
MASVFKKLRGMKTQKAFCAAFALGCLLAAPGARGQSLPPSIPGGLRGSTTNITQVMYYEPPHEQQIKLRLTGAEMSPLPEALFEIKQLQVWQYATDGRLQAAAESPQCIFAPMENIASSTNHLVLKSGDGKLRLEGDGYIWRQGDNSLTISNNVYAVLKTGTLKMTIP